jgi:VWFA-related protein
MSDPSFSRRRHVIRWLGTFLVISMLFLSSVPTQAQQKKEAKKSGDDEVIKVDSNLVSLDVIVKDKKGKAVTDLKPEDFTISENGVPQRIQFFDSTLTGGKKAGQPTNATDRLGESAGRESQRGVAPESKPRNTYGLPRNIISLVMDGQSTELSNLKHVRDGIVKYIRERITDSDSVAVFSISGDLQLWQPFTQDKAKLLAAVDKAYTSSIVSKTSEGRNLAENINSIRERLASAPKQIGPDSADDTPTFDISGGAALAGSAEAQIMIERRILERYLIMRSALGAQQSRPVLAALAAICEGLRPIPVKKTLVMFSEGFIAPDWLDWQVQSTIDIANRANVAIYIVDSTGLTGGTPTTGSPVVASPLSGISGENPMEARRRSAAGESVFDITRFEGLDRQQDLLYKLSNDTGGRFVKNTNDIASGLDRIDAEIRSRYTLAYRSTDQNFDSSFRKVKIEVQRSDLSVVTRPGYYAIPPSQIIPFSPDDRKLLANFSNMAAHPTLPLSVQMNSFRVRDGYYIVPLSFEIPPAAVQFERKGETQRLHLEVLGVVRAEGEDKILSRLGGNFDVALTAAQYEAIIKDKIFYRQDMSLDAGTYTIDLIVRDRLSGNVVAKREKLVLPVADSEFSVTEPVLSRHAEPLKQIGTNNDVLSEGNVQIRPSVSREFHSTDSLIIFFKLYNAALARETGKPLVRVTVTLTRDGKPAARPVDYQLTEAPTEPALALTFAKYLKLTGLAAGRYSAVIESRDFVRQKVSRQEEWFVIVP